MRLRAALWTLGAPVRAVLVALIRAYRLVLSGWLGGQCRFYPTCSRYAERAILEHGALRGSAMAAWRVARCGPFTAGGVDHVPARRAPAAKYEVIIQPGGGGP
ncbi:MAG TPA: membrane protein insertion efficiency factor YidD [Actinomycetota bacterium]|nr:membrane protein insertion efficiency factor YidD [Actinomycetota bacterium]